MRPFDLIPIDIQKILIKLEEQDHYERSINLDRLQRLRQIPRETGEFLYQFLLVHALRFSDKFLGLEIGASGGYSTIWQGQALQSLRHGKIISLEHDPIKYNLASKNIQGTPVENHIELIHSDAKEYLRDFPTQNLQYIFLDAEKKDYCLFYNLLFEDKNISSGVVLIADNLLSHKYELSNFIKLIQNDSRVSSIILPVGQGLGIVYWR